MPTVPSILLPDPKRHDHIKVPFNESIHQELVAEWNPPFQYPPLTGWVRPGHWMDRYISIQAAHNIVKHHWKFFVLMMTYAGQAWTAYESIEIVLRWMMRLLGF